MHLLDKKDSSFSKKMDSNKYEYEANLEQIPATVNSTWHMQQNENNPTFLALWLLCEMVSIVNSIKISKLKYL